MEIDPEALAAAGALCVRQQAHVEDMGRYLEGVLDRPEAFSGVLVLFAGSYAGAVAAGRRGLVDAGRAAGLMGRGMVRLRAEVLATDDDVARRMDRTRPDGRYSLPPGGPPLGGAAPTSARAPLALRMPGGADGGEGRGRGRGGRTSRPGRAGGSRRPARRRARRRPGAGRRAREGRGAG
ncbi:hypothetical protein [Nocardioides sp. AX2bis]|uniref:hypothetical protein n=1 Tax=Nocardioides sp. AX2bis TaxID=2653157 RepID=UPI0012F1E16D|nr:hypothetical protein [Nocardioides sp. AX2bis]VXC31385.1 hypothetical protein NOCARDAX2BIS_50119 [Nocardioides sp. AX2bis]